MSELLLSSHLLQKGFETGIPVNPSGLPPWEQADLIQLIDYTYRHADNLTH